MNEVICVVAICKNCRNAVLFKYTKSGVTISGNYMVTLTGIPRQDDKPTIEWCDCGSDEPRYLCKVTSEELPGLDEKCAKCEYRFSCASSRIEVVYNGHK